MGADPKLNSRSESAEHYQQLLYDGQKPPLEESQVYGSGVRHNHSLSGIIWLEYDFCANESIFRRCRWGFASVCLRQALCGCSSSSLYRLSTACRSAGLPLRMLKETIYEFLQ